MGIPRVRTELSVAYIDHNTLQSGFENADDHRFIQSMAEKYGLKFSRPGNGICHQVHLERFGKPGKTLIGSDSHTPTGGGIGMTANLVNKDIRSQFQVFVLPNLYGDIITDEAAEIQGGVGTAGSSNIGDQYAMPSK